MGVLSEASLFSCRHGSPLKGKGTFLEEKGLMSRLMEGWNDEDFAGSCILQSLLLASWLVELSVKASK